MKRIKGAEMLETLKKRWQLYVLVGPFLALFALMTALPVLSSIALSFFNFDMVSLPSSAGLGNYLRMFLQDDVFPIVLRNTLVLAVITGPLGFLLSFVLAWMINDFRPGVRTFLSFLFYAPALAGHALFIWEIAFSSDSYGYINSLLLSLGLITSPIQWLSNEACLVPIVILVQLWSSMGISFLANISGLQNVDTELYEAGVIDGVRNRWQELWYITLPGMRHMLLFSAVMQIAGAYSISATVTTLAGYPTVGYAADTLVSYLGDVGTVRYEMGYASALSVILFLMMAGTRLLTGNLLKKTGR